MEPTLLVALLTLAGTAVTVVGSYLGKHRETKAASADTATGMLMEHTRTVMERVESLEEQMSELRQELTDSERRVTQMFSALARGKAALQMLSDWASAGAAPPPPDVSAALAEMEAALTRAAPTARNPPA